MLFEKRKGVPVITVKSQLERILQFKSIIYFVLHDEGKAGILQMPLKVLINNDRAVLTVYFTMSCAPP